MSGTVPAPDLPPGPRSALIIATATYADQDLSQLRAPAQDAAALAGVLGDPAIGGFAVTQVVDQDERDIRRAVARFLAGRATSELVLVYLSCHGLLDARGRLHFAATDTDKGLLAATAVESTWLVERLEECRARQQILILDCCFSSAFVRSNKGTMDLEHKLARPSRGRVVLTASREGEYSFEGEALSDQQAVRSVFTAGLVEGLATGEADADRDGLVSVEDAFVYAARHVLDHGGGAQTPQRWLYAAEGSIVLARSPVGKVITPAPLPEHINAGLDNRSMHVRIGAVRALGALLSGPDPALALAARDALEQVVKEDRPEVATISREILHTFPDDRQDQAHYTLTTAATEPTLSREPGTQSQREAGATVAAHRRPRTASRGGTLIVTASADGTARIWDTATGKPRATIKGHSDELNGVAFSPDGTVIATTSDDRTARIWDTATGQLHTTLTGHDAAVIGVAFSPDGTLIATTSFDETARIWDTATGKPCTTLTGHKDWVWGVAFSPDGTLIATTSGDKTTRIWDTTTGQHRTTLTRPRTAVYGVAFSPDGTLIATSCLDHTARIWDTATGRRRITLTGHEAAVIGVAFSPDGTLIATTSLDKTARIWHTATSQHRTTLTDHTDKVRGVAFSPDGTLIATVSNDRTARIWDTATGQPRTTLTGHDGAVHGVAFSPAPRM